VLQLCGAAGRVRHSREGGNPASGGVAFRVYRKGAEQHRFDRGGVLIKEQKPGNHENKNLFNRGVRRGTQRMEIVSKKINPHWIPACAGMTMEAKVLLPLDKSLS